MKLEEIFALVKTVPDKTREMFDVYDSIMQYIRSNALENEITEDFKISYVELMLLFERKRVMNELEHGNYPLKRALDLVENPRLKHGLAIAFIKDRLGYFEESLDIYKKR